MHTLQIILDWSEIWALFIPLFVLWRYPFQPKNMKPIISYLYAALLLNAIIDFIDHFKGPLHFPHWLQTNNYLYNVHSIVRFIYFSMFFNRVLPSFKDFRKVISIVASIFLLV